MHLRIESIEPKKLIGKHLQMNLANNRNGRIMGKFYAQAE